MVVELKVADESDAQRWDELVARSPHGTIFHNWQFLKTVEKYSGTKLYPIMGLVKDEVEALLPIYSGKKSIFRMASSPPPWMAVPYLGPLIIGYGSTHQHEVEKYYYGFQEKVDEFLEKEVKPHYTVIATPPGLEDVRPYTWNGYTPTPLYNYITDLSQDEADIWKGIKKKTRQNITKTQREGLVMELGGLDEVGKIYESVNDRYREQGRTQPVPLDYIEDIYREYKDNLFVYTARKDGEYVSGHVDVCYKDKVSSWVGSAKVSMKGVYPNDMLAWEAKKHAKEEGYRYYEVIGANTPRLSPYKNKYNPRPELNFQVKKCSSAMVSVAEGSYKIMNSILGKVKK
ncbi:GNAT family N-acetyltransferase [Candidatus Altiarchaeota archaeon]